MEAEFAKGVTCLLSNSFKEAASIFEGLIEEVGQTPPLMHNLGLSYEGDGDTDRAIQVYEQNITNHPTHVISYLCLSICNLRKNKLYKAICWLKRAEENCKKIPVQLHILYSEAAFLSGNPMKGCERHAMALQTIDNQNVTLSNHHVQLFTDYGDGSMPYYSWLENSYISQGKLPTLEFLTDTKESIQRRQILVLVGPNDADTVKKQLDVMTEDERNRFFIVVESNIVERLMAPHCVDCRVVSSATIQNEMEVMAYVLDIAHEILQRFKRPFMHVLCPGEPLLEGKTIQVDGTVQATKICPMLLLGAKKKASYVYSMSSLL